MIRLETRETPARALAALSPLLALLATVAFGGCLFAALGHDPAVALRVFFVVPVESPQRLAEVALKMTPLLLCALGLAICYRANVWNIGAEGQFVVGGLCAGAVALLATPTSSTGFFVLVLLAGTLGGLIWAGITAWLRVRYHASEILVSLMLTYVGQLLLLYFVHGALRDPQGYNRPYSRFFEPAALVPPLWPPYRVTIGWAIAIVLALLAWWLLARSRAGFRVTVVGTSESAARYAGIVPSRVIALSLVLCGALAGLAGALEVAGPLGQLAPSISPGYGFAAIVVAWLGRLHPPGCVVAAALIAITYLGGELAQSRLGLPVAITTVFQGMLLLSLLAFDAFVRFRLRWTGWTGMSSTP